MSRGIVIQQKCGIFLEVLQQLRMVVNFHVWTSVHTL